MDTTSSPAVLTDTQKAFEFADKLNFYFCFASSSYKGSYSINTLILKYLGCEKYKKFCKNFRETNSRKADMYTFDIFFKEEFINNPVRNEEILFDHQILQVWQNLYPITRELIKLV